MDSDDQDCIVDDWWFDVIWSFWPATHLMPYWGIFAFSIEICRSPWICMIIPSCEIHVGQMIQFHFVLTLQENLSWVVQLGSYFLILLWFLDGVISSVWIPISPFQWSTCQISCASPLSYSWVIRIDRVHLMPYWGIFPHLAMEMIVLSQICYSFHHSTERYCICFTGHYSCDFHRDELLVEHDVQVVIVPLYMTLQ